MNKHKLRVVVPDQHPNQFRSNPKKILKFQLTSGPIRFSLPCTMPHGVIPIQGILLFLLNAFFRAEPTSLLAPQFSPLVIIQAPVVSAALTSPFLIACFTLGCNSKSPVPSSTDMMRVGVGSFQW